MEIDGGDGGDRAKWAPPGAGRREGAVVEARVASMVAQSEAVMATGIAAMAAVNGGRLGGGGGLDRARGASTILLKGTASS